MPSNKLARTNDDIQFVISKLLREVKDPRVSSMLSIVKVDVSGDLSYAKIYVSALEGEEVARESVKGLKAAAGFIRRRLGESLHLRKTPELRFVADTSIEKGFELFDKLRSIEEKNED